MANQAWGGDIQQASSKPSVGLGCTVRDWLQEAKVAVQISRKYPSTYVYSLLVLAILLGLGIGSLVQFKTQQEGARNARVLSMLDSTVATLELEVNNAFKPASSLAAFIHHDPYWPHVNSTYYEFLDQVGLQDRHAHFVSQIHLFPNGHIAASYPTSEPDDHCLGVDVLANANRERNLAIIKDPSHSFFPIVGKDAYSALQPLFITGVAENETFGYDQPATNCSECWKPEKQQKFWGFIGTIMHIQDTVAPRLQGLDKELKYALLCPSGAHISYVSVTPGAQLPSFLLGNTSYGILRSSSRLPDARSAVVSTVFVGPDHEWLLVAEVNNTDIHLWASLLMAAAVVLACTLAVLLFLTLASRRKLQLLLESLVPDSVIKQCSMQAQYLDGPKPILTAGSPADILLQVAAEIAAGRLPPIHEALTLRTAILKRWDMYTPINLGDQLQKARLESDVAAALMQQLAGADRDTKSSFKTAKSRHASVDSTWDLQEFDDLHFGLRALMDRRVLAALDGPDGDEGIDDGGIAITPRSFSIMPLDAAEQALTKAENCWQFDSFALSEATNGFPLSTLTFFLVHRQGLIHRWKLDAVAFARYLCAIESGYKDNPYHCSMHAADVLQTTHMILHHGGLIDEGFAASLVVLACYLAAAVHDYEHGGLTNDFLVNTQDDLACLYNDRSPLENHHVAAALTLMKQPGMNFLTKMPKSDFITLRKTMIDLVLATDMKQHFATITTFTANTASRAAPSMHTGAGTHVAPWNISESERQVVLQMAVKCADLGHTAAELDVHKRWLCCLEEEFFRQGDRERAAGLPISPLFDRSKPGASKSQTGFYNVVVLPMYTAFCAVFPACNPLLEGAKANYTFWQAAIPVASHSKQGVQKSEDKHDEVVLKLRGKVGRTRVVAIDGAKDGEQPSGAAAAGKDGEDAV